MGKMRPPGNNLTERLGVLHARVSSKDQEREGFSIPAQLELLRNYAAGAQISVTQEFVDIETAKQAGRSSFGEMVEYRKGLKITRTSQRRILRSAAARFDGFWGDQFLGEIAWALSLHHRCGLEFGDQAWAGAQLCGRSSASRVMG